MEKILSLDNPVFQSYAFYTAILLLKMLAFALLTGLTRLNKNIFITEEDLRFFKRSVSVPKLDYQDPDLKRIRRAHLNDVENILPFILITPFYLLTNPVASTAILVMKTFTITRFLYSVVYAIWVLPQPTRTTLWCIGYATNIYMMVKVACHFM